MPVADCAAGAAASAGDWAAVMAAEDWAAAGAVAAAGDSAEVAVAAEDCAAGAAVAVATLALGVPPVAAATLALGVPPVAAAALTAGRGVRRVSLAITMPTAAQSAASAINWVPISRRLSGLTEAAGAAAPTAYGACAALGLGVLAGIEGSSEPIFPPALADVIGPTGPIGTSGSELPETFNVPDPVLAVGVDVALPVGL